MAATSTIKSPQTVQSNIHYVLELSTLTRRLSQLKERAADMREPLDSFGEWFRVEMAEQFETEGDLLTGSHWKKLSPKYAAWKQKNYGDKKILQRTGDLMKSFSETSARGNVNRVSEHEGEWGSKIPYAVFHQRGTHKMPARPELSERTDHIAPQLAQRIGRWLMGEDA